MRGRMFKTTYSTFSNGTFNFSDRGDIVHPFLLATKDDIFNAILEHFPVVLVATKTLMIFS